MRSYIFGVLALLVVLNVPQRHCAGLTTPVSGAPGREQRR